VIVQNPDKYLDLVPAKDRERFKLPAASGAAGVEQRDVEQEGQR